MKDRVKKRLTKMGREREKIKIIGEITKEKNKLNK